MEQIRRELLEDALEFYQGFMQQQSDNPVIRLETAYAYDRVANIHGLLGNTKERLKNLRQYHHLLEELHNDYPADPEYRELLAHSFLALCHTLQRAGAQSEAIKQGRFALAKWETLAKDFPRNSSYRMEIIRWYAGGVFPRYYGAVDDKELETYLRRGLTLLDQWEADFPNQPSQQRLRSFATKQLAELMVTFGRFREAKEYYETPAAIMGKKLSAFSTEWPNSISDLEQAERNLRNQIQGHEQARADFPDLVNKSVNLIVCYQRLVSVLVAQDRFAEAEAVIRKKGQINEALLAQFPTDRERRKDFAWHCYNLGTILFWTGKLDEASAMYRDAFRILKELADEFPDVGKHQNHYAWVLVTCPAVEFRDPEQALRYAKRVVQLSPQTADYWFTLGYAQYRTGNFTDAIKSIERGRKFATGGVSLDAALVLAMAYWKNGDREKGVMLYRQLEEVAAAAPLFQTTSIDYRVQRAEADQIFNSVEKDSPAVSGNEQPPRASEKEHLQPEDGLPADKPNQREKSN